MGLYWNLFTMGLQNTATYRTNFFCRALFNLIPLLGAMTLWRAIFAGGKTDVGGYDLSELLSYYLLAAVVEIATAVTEDEWQVATDIKDGAVAQFLIRPLGYFRYRLAFFAANRVVYVAVAALPVGLIVLCHAKLLQPPASLALAVICAFSLLLSAVLQFLLAYLTALLAFWVLEISTFSFMLLAAQRIASGEMFPLELLPPWATQLLLMTPFPYCIYFPISLYMGKMSGLKAWHGLQMQLLWIAALALVVRLVWRQGVRSYTAVGG